MVWRSEDLDKFWISFGDVLETLLEMDSSLDWVVLGREFVGWICVPGFRLYIWDCYLVVPAVHCFLAICLSAICTSFLPSSRLLRCLRCLSPLVALFVPSSLYSRPGAGSLPV
jgi:hypothetical protein